LEELKSSMNVENYQLVFKNVPEQAIKDALKMLIRRYHFIQYMEQMEQREDWVKWLNKRRKSAKYVYREVQKQAKQE
jgi:hypothetical protein